MPNTTGYSFGDVVLVPFPFTDQTASKKRPAVVVSADAYHQRRPDVIVMAVTSQILRPAGALGEVLISDWQGAGLPKASLIKPVLTTIEQQIQRSVPGRCHPPITAVCLRDKVSRCPNLGTRAYEARKSRPSSVLTQTRFAAWPDLAAARRSASYTALSGSSTPRGSG